MAKAIHRFWSEYRKALCLSAGLLALSAVLHVWWQSSPMTLPEEIWQKKLDLHLSYYPFAIRPFQSWATLFLHDLLGFPVRESFFTLQFALAMALGTFFYRFLRLLEFTKNWSLVGVAILMFSYPILGAHFAPTHTWDDFWSYLLLVLAFSAVVQKRPVSASLFLTLGCFAREQVLVFYPLLLLWAWWSRQELNRARLTVMLCMPPLIYGAYRWIVYQDFELGRLNHLQFNFENALRTSDTIVSAWIAFGVLWLTVIAGLLFQKARPASAGSKLVFWGTVITLPITFLLTLSAGMARETRIFFPPFLFMIPISLYVLKDFYDRLRPLITRIHIYFSVVLVVVAIGLGYLAARLLFPQFDYGTNAEFRRQISGIHLGLSLSLVTGYVVLWWRERRVEGSSSRK